MFYKKNPNWRPGSDEPESIETTFEEAVQKHRPELYDSMYTPKVEEPAFKPVRQVEDPTVAILTGSLFLLIFILWILEINVISRIKTFLVESSNKLKQQCLTLFKAVFGKIKALKTIDPIPSVLGVALLLAMLPLPYAFYSILRVSMTIFLGIYVFKRAETKLPFFKLVWAVLILYNAVLPISLSRELWLVLNPICAAILFVQASLIKKEKN